MPIVQQGTINTTALVVPDLYVQIVPPQNLVLNGVPTDIIGVVGAASWGPIGQPVIVGSMAEYVHNFGSIIARRYDMGTQVATAVQQGAQNFRCVRISDGSETAAQLGLYYNDSPNGPFVLTAMYPGSYGNAITGAFLPGSRANTWRISISLPGMTSEIYDNIDGTGPNFWQNVVNAINNGQSIQRGPSRIVVASLGNSYTAMPITGTFSFVYGSPGSDGATSLNSAILVGSDLLPRRGMYALRGQGCSIGVLADLDDSTQWTAQVQFGLSEGLYMVCTGPAGDSIANAVSAKQVAGLDSYAAKLMFGDWIWWSDQANSTIRLVSPQGFVAGRLANLSPEQSSLNKPLYGVIGSQQSGNPGSSQNHVYSDADLQALLGSGIDLIANPQPGGSYWGVRGGFNSSSNSGLNGDNYTRLTNYIAATLGAGMGQFIGEVINLSLFQRIRATLLSYLQTLLQQGLLGSADGSLPFSVICDPSNNPPSRTSLGYVQADCQIRYQGINEKFIVNVEGGQTVQVQRQTLPTGQVGG